MRLYLMISTWAIDLCLSYDDIADALLTRANSQSTSKCMIVQHPEEYVIYITAP